jgi:hypothetical protein
MNDDSTKEQESENIDLGFVVREVDIRDPVPPLRKYLELMEAQIEEVQRCERVALDAERPATGNEEDLQTFWHKKDALEQLFEEDLIPTMRYSFIALLHIVFETHLRKFCACIQRERHLSLALRDIQGSPIDRAKTYFTKVAQLPITNFPEWGQLRMLQKIRDCIVHTYGYVAESQQEKEIRELAAKSIGLTIDPWGRLLPTKVFCEQHVLCVDTFFRKLSEALGWTT